MGYALDFGWLNGAIGMIASGAAMTIFLIAVTTVAGVILSIFGAAAKRSRYPVLRKAIGGLCRAHSQYAISGAALLHFLRAATVWHSS